MNYTYYKNYITEIVSVIEDNKEVAYLDYQADLFKGSNNNLVEVDDKYYLTSMSKEDFYAWLKHPATEDKFELLEVTDITDNIDDQGDQFVYDSIQSGKFDGEADESLTEAFYIGTVGCKEQLLQEIISILFTYSSWEEQDIMDIIFEDDVAQLKDGDRADEIYGEMADYITDSNEADISIKEAADEICGINLILDFEDDEALSKHENISFLESSDEAQYKLPSNGSIFWKDGQEYEIKNIINESGLRIINSVDGSMFNYDTLRSNGIQFQEPAVEEKVKKIKAISKAEYKELMSEAMSGLEHDIAADVQVDLSSQMIENPAIVKRVLIDNPEIQPEDVQVRIMWDMEMAI